MEVIDSSNVPVSEMEEGNDSSTIPVTLFDEKIPIPDPVVQVKRVRFDSSLNQVQEFSINDRVKKKQPAPVVSTESSQNEKTTESSQNEKTIESNQNEKTIESNQNEKTIESSQNEKMTESNQNEKMTESSQNEKTIESSQNEKTIENQKNSTVQNETTPITEQLNEPIVQTDQEKQRTMDEFDVDQYEQNLRQATEDTVSLLHRLCDRTDDLRQRHAEAHLKLEEAKKDKNAAETLVIGLTDEKKQLLEKQKQLEAEIEALRSQLMSTEEPIDTIEDTDIIEKIPPHPEKLWIEWHNVEAARVGDCILSRPTGATILPEGRILVADLDLGLLLFSIHSELIRQVHLPDWKWPQAPVYLAAEKVILVSMLLRLDETTWRRHICRFDLELNMSDKTVTYERLCAARNGYIYLSANSSSFSAIYQLAPTGKWTELHNKKGQTIFDIQVLAVIDPITELLVVETRRGYVWLLSVRESEIVARQTLCLVERPGALAIDDHRSLFIHDQSQAKIREISTIDGFEPLRDIALAEPSLQSISASNGYICVAYTDRKLVRIHRYASYKT